MFRKLLRNDSVGCNWYYLEECFQVLSCDIAFKLVVHPFWTASTEGCDDPWIAFGNVCFTSPCQPVWMWSYLSRNATVWCKRNSQSTMNVPTSKHLQPQPEGQTSIVSNQVIRWYVCPPWPQATQKLLAPGTIKWKRQLFYTRICKL